MCKKAKKMLKFPHACCYCEHATPLSDESTVLCDKKGIVPAEHKCRRFRYDLLKRKPLPPRMPELPDPEELSL